VTGPARGVSEGAAPWLQAVGRAVESVLAACEKAFLAAANILLLTMLAINLVNILSRFILDLGIIWVFPWTRVMFVWMVFLGFFVIYRRGKDITVDFVVGFMGEGGRRAVRVFVALMVIGLLSLILLQAPTLLPRQVGRLDMVGIQRYWLAVPFYVSTALILAQFLLDLARALRLAPEADAAAETGPARGPVE
jgi:TRAP-type C4-dicarboxylate transport system permease small subunit